MNRRRNRLWRILGHGFAMSWATLLLSSCGGGSSSGTPAAGSGNRAPRISGSPGTAIQAGTAYAFYPSASDPDGDQLTFEISNKPTWAFFDPTSGALTGTPSNAQLGPYSNIVISVSDGTAENTLAPFVITVAQNSMSSATVSWVPPTQNIDGTTLVDLAGYRIYYGINATAPSWSVEIASPDITTYLLKDLSPGTWYFSVSAYALNGIESDASNTASKTIQ